MACFSSTSACRPPPPFLARSSLTSACRRLLLFGLLFFNECSPLPPPPPLLNPLPPPLPPCQPTPTPCLCPPAFVFIVSFPPLLRPCVAFEWFIEQLDRFLFAAAAVLLLGQSPPPRPLFYPEKERGLRSVASRGLLLSYFQGHARTHGTARKRKSFAPMKGPSLALFCLQTGDSKRSG